MPSATEQKIIDAAVRLFAAQGYDATSVQEIVAAAEVTKGALYHYFRAKDDLLFEIYRLLITSQSADMDRIIGLGLSSADTVRVQSTSGVAIPVTMMAGRGSDSFQVRTEPIGGSIDGIAGAISVSPSAGAFVDDPAANDIDALFN